MLKFSKIKTDTQKVLQALFKPISSRSKASLSLMKKPFCIKNTKVSEKLQFLNSEEEMRKYFNIVDFDKQDADNIFDKDLQEQKNEILENQKLFENFDRKKLLEYIHKYKSELQNLDQDYENKNILELINEYSLPAEKLNFLNNKPDNYILVSNFQTFKSEEELIHHLRKYGEIQSYNFIKDLNGDNALVEVYYEQSHSVTLAVKYLNNKVSDECHFLKIKTNKNLEEEHLDNKTLIFKNFNQSLSHEAVFNEISSYGHILKFEMPLVNKVNASNKINKIIELGDNYLNILLNSVEDKNPQDQKFQIHEKAKFNFYYNYLKTAITEFKNVLNSYSDKIGLDAHVNILNNLLVEINFFLKKFFPEVIVNSLIKQEFEDVEKLKNNKDLNIVDESLKLRRQAFEKIFENLDKLVNRYDMKLKNLAKPLTKDEILIDLQDFENGGQDPEKINKNFLKKADGEEQILIIKKIEDMKLFSSFYPLEQQIAKFNFFKSLNDEEKKVLSEKHNLSFNINQPEFLDYFLKFNKAMGIEIFDRYIELTRLYLAMSPAEKMYHARNIISNRYTKRNIPNCKSGILDFLELKNIYTGLFNKYNQTASKALSKSPIEFMYNIIREIYKGMPKVTYFELGKLLNRNTLIHSKNRYLNFIAPINIKRNIFYSKKIRKMIVVYNNDVKELLKNYGLVTDPELKKKYDDIINNMKNTLFPNIFKPYMSGAQKRALYDQDSINETREATLEDFKQLDKESDIIKSASRDFIDHFKYSGKEMNENQIINRLEHLRTSISRITEFIMNITDKNFYKKVKMEKIDKMIKKKLLEDAEVLFADEPQLKSFYYKKINDQLSKFSYVHERTLRDTNFTFQEICQDLIYREYSYMQRVRLAMNMLSNIQENLDIKINKDNFVEAVSINGVLTHLNSDYTHSPKNYKKAHFFGSPVVAYMRNIKTAFSEEKQKLEKIKEYKLSEVNIPTLDEAQSTRSDLIENYTNRIAEFELLKKQRAENEIKNDLENYKFEAFIKGDSFVYGNNNIMNVQDSLFKRNLVNSSLLNIEKEILKKEFEIIQNINKNSNDNEIDNSEIYKDVSSLVKNINNLNKEKNDENNDNNINTFNNVDKILKSRRLMNKGYAFVTFATSDEAKRVYLEGQLGIKIKNKLCDIEPKFDKTHNNMDIIRLMELAKKDSVLLGKQDEIKVAEKKIIDFESQLDEKLDKKQREMKKVIEAYKDLYSDPFKKHDANNPFSKEEEEKLKYSLMKLEKEKGVSNYWILEEDKLDELRKIKDKRMIKTYLDWQLLRKGVIPEDVLNHYEENSKTALTNKNVINEYVGQNFSDKEKFELKVTNAETEAYYKGGRLTEKNIFDKKEFIENHLGKDYIYAENYGFKKDKRDEAIYSEIKELRERFPKELFEKKFSAGLSQENKEMTSMDVNIEKLIENVNKKYIDLINQNSTVDEKNELTKVELLDRITNLSPINKKVQLIISERNRLVENEELKQSITLKNFLDKNVLTEINKNGKLVDKYSENIMYNTLQDVKYETSPMKKYLEKDQRTFKEFGQKREFKPRKPETLVEPSEGDSSFNAFLIRRRIRMEQEEKKRKDAANKTQFDPEKITIEQIKETQKSQKDKIIENIKLKYQMQMSSIVNSFKDIDSVKPSDSINPILNNNTNNDLEDNVFEYLKNKKLENKYKLEKFNETLQIEKKKTSFIAELERNFAKEIETFPSFKEYFLSIKNNKDPIEEKIKADEFSVENLKNLISYKTDASTKDTFRDMIGLLNRGKISTEEYEKYFVKEVENKKNKLENWINDESINVIVNEVKHKLGVTPENEKMKMKIIEAKYPLLSDQTIDHLKNYRELSEKMDFVNNSEDFFESEYFFSAEPVKLLEELSRLSKLKNTKVEVKFDEEARFVIKRVYKNAYKYDLDEIMNFDITEEKQKLIANIKNNDFLKDFEKEVRAVTKFLNEIIGNNLTLSEKKSQYIDYVNKLVDAFDFRLQTYFNNKLISFTDFRNAIVNLENCQIKDMKNVINSVITILNIPNVKQQSAYDLTENLKCLSAFSKGIFSEREISSLGIIMLFINKNLEEGQNIPLIEQDFDANTRKNFINSVLVKSIEHILESEFTKKDMLIFKCLLVNDSNYVDNLKIYDIVKIHMWKNYKNIMTEKYSLLFKKENEISNISVNDLSGNIRDLYEIIKFNSQKNIDQINTNLKNIQDEINAFSNKLQEYYIDVANMNTSDDYIDNLVSDDELFFDEISEQIEKRITKQKYAGKLNKSDLIKRRYNETNLLKKQMNDIDKYEKYLEGLTLNDYFSENKEMLTELRRIINECKKRRQTLLSQGKPLIDYDFPRMI